MQRLSQKTTIFLYLIVFLLGITTLSAFFVPVTAIAQAQTVTMDISPAYQGYFKYGEWLPIWVTLENNGSDLEAEVQVRVVRDIEQTTYVVPLTLPAGARKRLPLYVLPNNYSHELNIELVIESETKLTQTAVVHPQPNINFLIGVVANQRGALTLVPGIQLPGGRLPVPVDISLDELPDRPESLRSLDSLILNDIDSSSLTSGQVNALIGWVQQGGRLVIGGGAGARQTTAGLTNDILPLMPNALKDLERLDALSSYANTTLVRVPGPFVIATGNQQQGQTLVEQDGYPLVLERSLGKGYVTFVALDLTATPFDAWTGTTAFWETLLSPGASYPSWRPPDMSEQQMIAGPIGNALSNIPSLDLPSARGILILLGIYIILVGPVNYLLLRWRRKLHWGWVTIPSITLIFSAMSFGYGYAKRGTDLIINKIAIIQGEANGPALISSYIGLFSPANQGYQLEISGDNLLSPMSNFYSPWQSSTGSDGSMGNLTFVQSIPNQVRGLNVNQWSMQSFMTETIMDDIGPIKADLRLDGQYLEGSVTNETGYPLTDVVLILKHNYVKLGDLPSGESANIELKLEQGEIFGTTISWKIYEDQYNSSITGPPSREIEFKRMVLEAVLDQQNYYGARFIPGEIHSATELNTIPELTFIGWADWAPPEVRVNGIVPQETATSLFKTKLNYKLPRQGDIVIPPGFISGLVAEMPLSAGPCGVESASIWLNQGEAIIEFILPPEFTDFEIDSLQFLIQSDGSWANPPKLDIYNWETTSWQSLDGAGMGLNSISSPINNINADGLVRFQISLLEQDFQGGACYYTGLGLKGSH